MAADNGMTHDYIHRGCPYPNWIRLWWGREAHARPNVDLIQPIFGLVFNLPRSPDQRDSRRDAPGETEQEMGPGTRRRAVADRPGDDSIPLRPLRPGACARCRSATPAADRRDGPPDRPRSRAGPRCSWRAWPDPSPRAASCWRWSAAGHIRRSTAGETGRTDPEYRATPRGG